MSTYAPLDIAFVRGEGCYLVAENGEKYLDAFSGVAVANLGHSHPEISAAIIHQAQTLIHTSNWYRIENQEKLARSLCEIAKMDKAFFANSGAEANEAMIKISRLYAREKKIDAPIILTARGSFHGRTLATLSATGNEKIQAGFAPLAPGFVHFDFDNIDAILPQQKNPDVVAVMLEPILGEGGIVIPKPDYLNQVREICTRNGWLLMLDEVQTGIGRTGAWFAHQQNRIVPDVMSLAKGLGGGFPIGACLAKGAAAKLFTPATHGSTFGGNPLASAVALRVLEIIHRDNVLENVRRMSAHIVENLRKKLSASSKISEIRAAGLMIAITMKNDARPLVFAALREKLLIGASGSNIRLLPPLIIQKNEADELVEKIVRVVEKS